MNTTRRNIWALLAMGMLALLGATSTFADSPIQPGDRIAIVGNTFADQLRNHGYLETLLLQHSRANPVSIRNLGWAGDMLAARDRPTGFPSEESTLTDHKTDVIIACFGMGESFDGEKALGKFKSELERFIASHAGKKYNGESNVRLVLVSPIACDDLRILTPERQKRNRELEAYSHAMREVAGDAGVPFVDLFQMSRYLMNESTGPKLTDNGIHLNSFGYWAMSSTFYDQLTTGGHFSSHQPWLLRLDAKAKKGDARGVEVSKVASDESGITFQVNEKTVPCLPPPSTSPLPPRLESGRDTLIVENLMPGTYRLTVDGEEVVAATAQAWTDGVAIDASPAHKAAEAYRAAANDKNLQFTYSWKALNQVHIVGERKSSKSGRALPQEVIEFNKLAIQRDQALRKGVELKTRQWRLSRVSQ